jgi:3-keto-disaccharide hydrolase
MCDKPSSACRLVTVTGPHYGVLMLRAALLLLVFLPACQGLQPLIPEGRFGDWQKIGQAEFSFADGILTGTGRNLARNSFLASPRTYADFELQAEIWIAEGGNSGIQIRSHIDPDGSRVFGYQIEIDTSERAWSGGLYDEGRRGWLDNLEDQPQARAAFKNGAWNHYRIVCRGDSIRSWVNGVPCADFHDDADAQGYLAFQVHSGKQAIVKWRNLRLREL